MFDGLFDNYNIAFRISYYKIQFYNKVAFEIIKNDNNTKNNKNGNNTNIQAI
jgi:hypothetical protein